jgi:hypothetical protein
MRKRKNTEKHDEAIIYKASARLHLQKVFSEASAEAIIYKASAQRQNLNMKD